MRKTRDNPSAPLPGDELLPSDVWYDVLLVRARPDPNGFIQLGLISPFPDEVRPFRIPGGGS